MLRNLILERLDTIQHFLIVALIAVTNRFLGGQCLFGFIKTLLLGGQFAFENTPSVIIPRLLRIILNPGEG